MKAKLQTHLNRKKLILPTKKWRLRTKPWISSWCSNSRKKSKNVKGRNRSWWPPKNLSNSRNNFAWNSSKPRRKKWMFSANCTFRSKTPLWTRSYSRIPGNSWSQSWRLMPKDNTSSQPNSKQSWYQKPPKWWESTTATERAQKSLRRSFKIQRGLRQACWKMTSSLRLSSWRTWRELGSSLGHSPWCSSSSRCCIMPSSLTPRLWFTSPWLWVFTKMLVSSVLFTRYSYSGMLSWKKPGQEFGSGNSSETTTKSSSSSSSSWIFPFSRRSWKINRLLSWLLTLSRVFTTIQIFKTYCPTCSQKSSSWLWSCWMKSTWNYAACTPRSRQTSKPSPKESIETLRKGTKKLSIGKR